MSYPVHPYSTDELPSAPVQRRWAIARPRGPDGTTQQLTQLYFAVAPRDKTQSEIYSPEFEVLDMHESLSDTLADEFAVVANNGSITWTRGGHIRAACDVEALDFPFMSPECSISLGAFAEPLQIYPDVIRKWEAKLLPAWEHYLFARCAELRMTGTNVSSKPFSATSVSCVATGEKTMKLSVTITWSAGPYWRSYILPHALVTAVALTGFWISGKCGERLAVNTFTFLTGLVIRAAAGRAVEPGVGRGTLMFSYFSTNNMISFFALMQCALVIQFHFKFDAHYLPEFIQKIYAPLLLKRGIRTRAADVDGMASGAMETEIPHDQLVEGKTVGDIKIEMNRAQIRTHSLMDCKSPSGYLGRKLINDGVSIAEPGDNESLGDWLLRVGFLNWLPEFQRNGIYSLADIVECDMNDQDLKEDIGIRTVMERRRLLNHIGAITGGVKFDEATVVNNTAQQIRDGMMGHRDVAIAKGERGLRSGLDPQQRPVGYVGQEDDEHTAEQQTKESSKRRAVRKRREDNQRYWIEQGNALDRIAQFLFPLAFALNFGLSFGSHLSKL